MNKKLFSALMLVASLFTMSAFAQAPTTTAAGASCCKTEKVAAGKGCCKKDAKACDKAAKACKDCKDCKAGKDCKSCNNCADAKACCKKDGKACAKESKACGKEGKGCCKQGARLFEGVNLTAEQQTKLAALRESQQAKAAQAWGERAKMSKEVRKERAKVAREEARKDRAERDSMMKANKRAYLDGVKQILTPEQYVVFLENAYFTATAPKHGDAPKHGKKN